MMKRLATLALAGAMTLGLVSAAPAAQGSGCLPTTGTVSGLAFAQAINSAIAALISGNSGASSPATDCTGSAVKGQVWLDTSVTPNVERRFDGTNWVVVGAIDSANHVWTPPVGGGTAAITAAETTDLCAAPAALQTISGTTAITSFGSACVIGTRKTLLFNSATPLTYNAASMILPGKRSFTAAPGDMADALYLGYGNWRISISKIDGGSVTNPAIPLGTVINGTFGEIPPKTVYGMGQALARSSYSDYLAAVTRAQTGTLTSGNNTITSVGNTSGLGAGMPIEGVGIQAGTTISSVTSSTIVMSANATASGSHTVTAFLTGYGSGGDSTTVGVTDCRGRVLAGRADPLGTNTGRLTSSGSGVDGLKVNAFGGVESLTLARNQLPNVALSVSANGSTASDLLKNNGTAAASIPFPDGGTISPPRYLTGSSDVTVTGTTSSINGGVTQVSMNNMPPVVVAECVVVVLP